MSGELRRSAPLLLLFVIGLGAGVWVAVSPWAVGFPVTTNVWTGSIWTAVWVGAIVAAASAISLVAVLAHAVHVSIEASAERR